MFLSTLEEATGLHRLEVSGYGLMPNHYHLLFATPYANLSKAMGWFQSTYTIRFNGSAVTHIPKRLDTQ